MAIRTNCPECGKEHDVHSALAGIEIDCNNCGHTIRVPVLAPVLRLPEPEEIEVDDQDIIVRCPQCSTQYAIDKHTPVGTMFDCDDCGHLFAGGQQRRKSPMVLRRGKKSGTSRRGSQTLSLKPRSGVKPSGHRGTTEPPIGVTININQPHQRPGYHPQQQGGSAGLIIGGYVCAALAIIIVPFLFSTAAFVFGCVNLAKGQTGHGVAQIVLSFVCGFIGALLSFVVWSAIS
jgi:ribosomal protein L37AE/L43A